MKRYLMLTFLLELFLVGVFLASSSLAEATSHATGTTTVELVNPLDLIGIREPGDLVLKVFQGFAALMGAVAIAFVVFSGFKLIVSTAEESIKAAKEGLKWAVGGFVLSLLSFTIIAGAAKFLGFTPSQISGYDAIKNPILIPGGEGPSGDFVSVMFYVMVNFLGLLGFATTLVIIYYGYRYITAAGNEEAIKQAKEGLKWALLGLAVVLLAFTIITAIRQYLIFGLPK